MIACPLVTALLSPSILAIAIAYMARTQYKLVPVGSASLFSHGKNDH